MIDKLKTIATKATISSSDKKYITSCYKEMGMELNINKQCPDCWRDAAVVIIRELEKSTSTEKKWRYNACGRSIWTYRGATYILDENTDEGTIERYVAMYGEGLYTKNK